ncbi:hypothetical protein PSP6_580025 [Paraburkholderia tropica]|nr:hypothetical protein PSP6_580025 [Paraburkholderia tropica]
MGRGFVDSRVRAARQADRRRGAAAPRGHRSAHGSVEPPRARPASGRRMGACGARAHAAGRAVSRHRSLQDLQRHLRPRRGRRGARGRRRTHRLGHAARLRYGRALWRRGVRRGAAGRDARGRGEDRAENPAAHRVGESRVHGLALRLRDGQRGLRQLRSARGRQCREAAGGRRRATLRSQGRRAQPGAREGVERRGKRHARRIGCAGRDGLTGLDAWASLGSTHTRAARNDCRGQRDDAARDRVQAECNVC